MRRSRWTLALLASFVVGCGRAEPSRTAVAPATNPAPQVAPSRAETVSAGLNLRISPERWTLEPGEDGLQLLLDGADGDRVAWSAEPAGIVRVEPDGYVRPLGPGQAVVRASLAGGQAASAVIAVGEQDGRAWDFAAEVVPILTRFGCNAGSCHGKADGQNGFHLSLFGYDPEGDYRALAREAGGRRLAPLAPERSLLVLKATGQAVHAGGQRIVPGSDAHRRLLDWIAAGAPERRGRTHGPLVAVRVDPPDVHLGGPGAARLRVIARFEDGQERDVTRLATFKSTDDGALTISPDGQVRLHRRAEADLIIRYGSHVLATRVSTPINPGLRFDFDRLPRRNVVDVELFKRLAALKVPPSPPAGDAAFLRRVTLDLTGGLPRPDEIRAFLDDPDTEKRAKKVDELLARKDFVTFWKLKLGDLLGISQARFGAGAGAYQVWLTDRLERNVPWDEMVRQLLTALGDPRRAETAAAAYALDAPDAKTRAELTAQRFLGLRLRCAQCHDHPFDVWTQDDYYGFAALFAKVGPEAGAPPDAMMGRPVVKVNPQGAIEHLRRKVPAAPRLLDGQAVAVGASEDPRRALADWITKSDNPYFARATANWAWAQLFGRGIADPADDLGKANPPIHPELLDALARHFVEAKYDLRDLVRTIATSEAYGLASATVPGNEGDTRLFSHHLPRPLTAHQMADAIAQATDVPNRFSGFGAMKGERRAIEVFDPGKASDILDTFGRCPRTIACAAVNTPTLSLRQALLLIGGDVVEAKLGDSRGYLAAAIDVGQEPEDLARNLYLRTLCRPPTEEELSHWAAELKGAGSLREAAEDLFWALLNAREFAFNH